MCIPKGVNVLVWESKHGKSTILEAIAQGIYNHIPGDGHGLVVTEPTAVKICANARVAAGADIAPFFTEAPGYGSIEHRAIGRASGSIAMAINIQEALESNSRLLLVDEDDSASDLLCDSPTTLLNRKQPNTPVICKVRCLLAGYGTNIVIVRCGLDNWRFVANTIIDLSCFNSRNLPGQTTEVRSERLLPNEHIRYGSLPSRVVSVPTSFTI